MNSYQDTYNGKPYYATNYEVYQNNKLVLKTSDNRTGIENPMQNWSKIRSELRNAMNDCKVYLVPPEVFHKLQEKDELSKTIIREQAHDLKETGLIKDEEVYVNEMFAVQVQEAQQSISPLVLKEVLDNYEKQLVAINHSKSISDSQTLSDQRSSQKAIEQKQTLLVAINHSKSMSDSQTLSDQRSGQKAIEQKQTLLVAINHSKSMSDSQTLSDQRSGQKAIEQKQTLNEKKEKISRVKEKAKTNPNHSKEIRSNERERS